MKYLLFDRISLFKDIFLSVSRLYHTVEVALKEIHKRQKMSNIYRLFEFYAVH